MIKQNAVRLQYPDPDRKSLVLVVKTCKGRVCVLPWQTLQPQGNVNSLADAMDRKYDIFHAGKPKVAFKICTLEYSSEAEFPSAAMTYGTNLTDYTYTGGTLYHLDLRHDQP